jgi:hypothetical protein
MSNLLNKEKNRKNQEEGVSKKSDVKTEPNKIMHITAKPIQKTVRPIPVNVGIDFGTSFTKVCFSESQNSHIFVPFNGSEYKLNGSEYKPSIIYYDFTNKIFYYNKPDGANNIETIEYFKYSMISDSLPRSKNLLKEMMPFRTELLCSLFFIACLIKEIREYITGYFTKKAGKINIDWSFTMGVPIENYDDKNKRLYDRILNIADNLSKELTKYSVTLNSLFDYYTKFQNINLPLFGQSKINTLPELYAESLAFLKDRNIDSGVYILMDVGGGTVDMAILYKESPSDFSVTSKDIKPLGIEIVSKSISKNNKDIASIKIKLRDNKTLSDILYILTEKESELKECLRKSFAELVMDSKMKRIHDPRENKHVFRLHNGELPVIICGGGAKHKWYEDGVMRNSGNLRPVLAEGLKLKILPLEKLFSATANLNHRLLIAYALSGRIGSEITELQGYPWHFYQNDPVKNDGSVTNYDRLQKVQKELYGEN